MTLAENEKRAGLVFSSDRPAVGNVLRVRCAGPLHPDGQSVGGHRLRRQLRRPAPRSQRQLRRPQQRFRADHAVQLLHQHHGDGFLGGRRGGLPGGRADRAGPVGHADPAGNVDLFQRHGRRRNRQPGGDRHRLPQRRRQRSRNDQGRKGVRNEWHFRCNYCQAKVLQLEPAAGDSLLSAGSPGRAPTLPLSAAARNLSVGPLGLRLPRLVSPPLPHSPTSANTSVFTGSTVPRVPPAAVSSTADTTWAAV